jgi:hypothetical protein
MDDDTPSPPPLALINLAGHLIARTARYASDYRLERPITPSPPPLALINLAGHLIARTARYASDYRLERPIPCCPRVATKPRHSGELCSRRRSRIPWPMRRLREVSTFAQR